MMYCDFSPMGIVGAYNPQWGLPSGADEWMMAWIVAGALLLVALVIVVILRRRRVKAIAAAAAKARPGIIELGPTLPMTTADARVVTSGAWPEMQSNTNGWATRAVLLEPSGNAWRESGEAAGLVGPPEQGIFVVPSTTHPVLGLDVVFERPEQPTREVAIVGEQAAMHVIGVILHAADGSGDLEWKAVRAPGGTGDILRVTFPRSILTHRMTIILRPKGPVSIAGVALVHA